MRVLWPWVQRRIARQLGLVVLLAAICVTLVAAALLYQLQRREHLRDTAARLGTAAHHVKGFVEHFGAGVALEAYASVMSEHLDSAFHVVIYDPDGKVRLSCPPLPARPPGDLAEELEQVRSVAAGRERLLDIKTGISMDISVPLHEDPVNRSRVTGVAHVGRSLRDLELQFASRFLETVAAGTLALGLLPLIVGRIVYTRIVAPLEVLMRAIRQAGQNLDEARSLLDGAGAKRADEIGYMFQALDRMICDLREGRERETEALRAAEAGRRDWEHTFDGLEELAVIHDTDGRVTRVNRALSNSLGCHPRELIGRSCHEIFPNVDHGQETMLQLERPAGRFRVTTSSIELGTESARHVVHLASDVTESYARQLELVRLGLLVEEMRDGAIITDAEGTIVYVNPAFCRLFGYTSGELEGNSAQMLYFPHLRPTRDEVRELTLQPGGFHGEMELRGAGDRRVPVWVWLTPTYDETRKLTGRVGVMREIGAERRLRDQLVQAEKLSAVGQLISGVAHELNNPLSVVLGYADILRADGTAPPQLVEDLGRIREGALRCQRIVRNLLGFARRYRDEMAPAFIGNPMEAVRELLGNQYRVEGIDLRVEVAPDVPTCLMDAHKLQQVFLNLVQNARDAMRSAERGSAITLRALRDGDWLVAEVEDDGPGIPASMQHQIFEPFFTTKPPGQGTGLGLAICQGIVVEHGGSIGVQSEPGRGSTFRLRLPIRQTASAQDSLEQAAGEAPSNRRILVIDDDADTLSVMCRLLAEAGHYPEPALGGKAGMQKISTSSAYDLIICDFRMPDAEGRDVYAHIRRTRPELSDRFLLATGDTVSDAAHNWIEESGVKHIAKPFKLAELKRVMDPMLVRG